MWYFVILFKNKKKRSIKINVGIMDLPDCIFSSELKWFFCWLLFCATIYQKASEGGTVDPPYFCYCISTCRLQRITSVYFSCWLAFSSAECAGGLISIFCRYQLILFRALASCYHNLNWSSIALEYNFI